MNRPAPTTDPRTRTRFGALRRAALLTAAGLFACAAVSVTQAQQKLYRWVDETGKVRFSDRPPPSSAKQVDVKALGSKSSDRPSDPYALQIARKNNPVTLYTAPDCGEGCVEARRYLGSRGVPFDEISVTDSARFEELKKATGQTGVPVMFVGKAMHKGYEQGMYERALDAGGYPKVGILAPRQPVAVDTPPKPEAPQDTAAQSPKKPDSPPLGPYAPRFGSEKTPTK